jgi:hypothetical protein
MSDNMPILWRNTLAGMSEEAGALYLRGAARNEMQAFDMACRYERRIKPFLDKLDDYPPFAEKAQTWREVRAFIAERHFRQAFPDGRAA